MISAAVRTSSSKSVVSLIHDAPGWVWCGLALAYIGVKSSFTSGGGIYGNIGDSDDLTRLIQVRELIAYGHWFDTTTLKMGGDGGMLSHWSRLIDLPLVLLIKLFSIFMPVEDAERVTHIVWPLLVLSCLLAAIYRCVQAVAGKLAACIALALVVLAPCDWYQFSVGRIDHHNVMIAATVSAALLMWSGPQRTTQWVLAGALTGLALAVGYEALAPAVALGVLAAVWSLVDKSMSKPAAAFALALAAVFDLSFLATISPARWMDIHCDAISLNMVMLITTGAAALAVTAGPGQNWPMAARIAIIALFSAAGVVAFGALEPKCLAGPMGQLPPALKPIWLDKVAEAQSIFSRLFDGQLKHPLALLATFLIALATQWAEVRKARRPADVFLLAALAVFGVLACWQMKYISYAGCLAVVPVAIAISRLGATGNISATTVRATANRSWCSFPGRSIALSENRKCSARRKSWMGVHARLLSTSAILPICHQDFSRRILIWARISPVSRITAFSLRRIIAFRMRSSRMMRSSPRRVPRPRLEF